MTVTSMLDKVLKIATRQSPLALWQAQYVKARLEQAHPGLKVELVPMVTRGDVILDTPLAKVGGKGLFVKELELAMLEGRADSAVHLPGGPAGRQRRWHIKFTPSVPAGRHPSGPGDPLSAR